MKRSNRWPQLLIPGIILSTGLVSYFVHFHDDFSKIAQDWGSFGSFINPFVTLTNVGLFIFFSLLVYRYNNSINRPVLTFKTEIEEGVEVWQIVNIGSGPALNLTVGHKLDNTQDWQSTAVKCYSLGKDDKVSLDWLKGSIDIIGVYYSDIFDERYFAIVGNDVTEIRKYSSFKSLTINSIIYQKKDIDQLLQLTQVRITRIRKLNSNKSSSLSSTESTKREG
jgi:hypothetical protein